MSFMSKSATTTGLLAVNAVLLLILVVQNASKPKPFDHSAIPMTDPGMMSGSQMPPGHPPINGMGMGGQSAGSMGGSAPMAADSGGGEGSQFDPTLMIMAAMNCPGDATLTLDANACSGGDAETRKTFVREAFQKESSIRGVFDAVVKKFGDNALTDQARAIRKSRKTN